MPTTLFVHPPSSGAFFRCLGKVLTLFSHRLQDCISKFKAQLSYIKGSSNIAGFTAWSVRKLFPRTSSSNHLLILFSPAGWRFRLVLRPLPHSWRGRIGQRHRHRRARPQLPCRLPHCVRHDPTTKVARGGGEASDLQGLRDQATHGRSALSACVAVLPHPYRRVSSLERTLSAPFPFSSLLPLFRCAFFADLRMSDASNGPLLASREPTPFSFSSSTSPSCSRRAGILKTHRMDHLLLLRRVASSASSG